MTGAALTCPICGERALVRVVYGPPTRETEQAAARGEVVLGGCLVSGSDPEYVCAACGFELPSAGSVR